MSDQIKTIGIGNDEIEENSLSPSEAHEIISNFCNGLEWKQGVGIEVKYNHMAEKLQRILHLHTPAVMLAAQDDEGHPFGICPKCSTICTDGEWVANYCPDCGQRVYVPQELPYCTNCYHFEWVGDAGYGKCNAGQNFAEDCAQYFKKKEEMQ